MQSSPIQAPTYPQIPQRIFPVIDIGNFVLREKCDADAEDFFRYYSDPEVNKFILCEIPKDAEEARRELDYWRRVFYQNDGLYFAIADKKDNRLIGTIGLTSHNVYQSRVELSYDLAREYWRRGITSAAIKAALKYGFQILKVNRIEAVASTENFPSRNLLLKMGFTLEGVLRQHRYHRGRYVDVHSFSILRSEYIPDQI